MVSDRRRAHIGRVTALLGRMPEGLDERESRYVGHVAHAYLAGAIYNGGIAELTGIRQQYRMALSEGLTSYCDWSYGTQALTTVAVDSRTGSTKGRILCYIFVSTGHHMIKFSA